MRAVPSYNTSAEMKVRKILYPIAPGYRLNRKDIPGKPDIAYIGAKRAIFVHGCFWHGHECKRGARVPKTNNAYWTAKISRNKARDGRNFVALKELGWKTLVIWECELKEIQKVERRLRRFTDC